jgi:hypothetical protein
MSLFWNKNILAAGKAVDKFRRADAFWGNRWLFGIAFHP